MLMTVFVSAREEQKSHRQWGSRHMHTLIKMEIKKFWFEKTEKYG